MWYAMQVKAGSEDLVKDLCKSHFGPPLLLECFYPKQEVIRKINGVRKKVKKILFPGYLILDSQDIETLDRRLWQVPELTKVLKVGTQIVPLADDEREFIERHGDSHRVFRMCKGYQHGKYIKIEEGAFAGFYGEVENVDRHNRLGMMRIHMFGREHKMNFGLEIVERFPEPLAGEPECRIKIMIRRQDAQENKAAREAEQREAKGQKEKRREKVRMAASDAAAKLPAGRGWHSDPEEQAIAEAHTKE